MGLYIQSGVGRGNQGRGCTPSKTPTPSTGRLGGFRWEWVGTVPLACSHLAPVGTLPGHTQPPAGVTCPGLEKVPMATSPACQAAGS